jgi:hypothetical protein
VILLRYADFRSAFAPGAKVRASGFGDSISFDLPIASWPVVITCNGGAPDATSGVDDYDWYLSQRTDDPDSQYFFMTSEFGTSGTVTLHLNDDVNVGKLCPGVANPIDDESLYCRRKSDGAIDLCKMLARTLVKV